MSDLQIPELEKTNFGYRNVIVGWIWCILGFWMGMVIGWWSFDHMELFTKGSDHLNNAFGPVLYSGQTSPDGTPIKAAMFSMDWLRMSGQWFHYDMSAYGSTARRLTRLAHVCFIMIPCWNILYGKDIDNTYLTPFWKNFGSLCMIQAAFFLPGSLVVGALVPVFKYVMIPFALFACIGMTVMAVGKYRLYNYHKSLGIAGSIGTAA